MPLPLQFFRLKGFQIFKRNDFLKQEIRVIIECEHFCLLEFSLGIFKIKIYKTIILPVVLYGCEAWSLTLREECKLNVFENRILRRIFGPKRDFSNAM